MSLKPYILLLAVLANACGHHSAIYTDLESTRDGDDRAALNVEVGCYDSSGSESLSDWWNSVDDCTQLRLCWRVRWYDEPWAMGTRVDPPQNWLDEHLLATDEDCATMEWLNDHDLQPKAYSFAPPPAVDNRVRGGVVEFTGEVDAPPHPEYFAIPPTIDFRRRAEQSGAIADGLADHVELRSTLLINQHGPPLPCQNGVLVAVASTETFLLGTGLATDKLSALVGALQSIDETVITLDGSSRCIVLRDEKNAPFPSSCYHDWPMLRLSMDVGSGGLQPRLDTLSCHTWTPAVEGPLTPVGSTKVLRGALLDFVRENAFAALDVSSGRGPE